MTETVAKYGLHALRHACASLWIEQGLNPNRIQLLRGHSSIKMTYDLYRHLFEGEHGDQRAAEPCRTACLPKQLFDHDRIIDVGRTATDHSPTPRLHYASVKSLKLLKTL